MEASEKSRAGGAWPDQGQAEERDNGTRFLSLLLPRVQACYRLSNGRVDPRTRHDHHHQHNRDHRRRDALRALERR